MKIAISQIREGASRVLEHASLRDVRVLDVKAFSPNPIARGPYYVESEAQAKGERSADGEEIYAFARYVVRAVVDEDRGLEAWRVEVNIVATFECSGGDLSEEDLTSFALAIGLMTNHPYARERVQSTVASMGYPPFTLALMEPITAGPDDLELEFTHPTSAS